MGILGSLEDRCQREPWKAGGCPCWRRKEGPRERRLLTESEFRCLMASPKAGPNLRAETVKGDEDLQLEDLV